MTCQHCRGAETLFDQRGAEQQLRRYQRHGPEHTTRLLVLALQAAGIAGATVLDIGGGIGAVHHELLRSGASQAVDVDAASAYLRVARQESERQGHAGRVSYMHGDFVALAGQLVPADIVTLDRVVCCYPDMPALLTAAAGRAGRLIGLVYPQDTWWVRLGIRVLNAGLALQGSAFRVYCHPTAAVDALLRAQGLTRQYRQVAGFWQVVVYGR